MTDWIEHLTKPEAAAIIATMDDPKAVKTRFEGRNDAGERVTRYTMPTKGQMGRIRAKATEE